MLAVLLNTKNLLVSNLTYIAHNYSFKLRNSCKEKEELMHKLASMKELHVPGT